jgi:5S rRNA maturation endonuclease (ribonuclease M5)
MVSFVAADILRQGAIPYIDASAEESAIKPKHCLYNVDSVKKTMIVVEGVTDVWRIGDGAVATLTSNPSKEQILAILKKKPKKVVVMYDPDAEDKGQRLADQLSGLIPSVKKVVLDSGDPADMTDSEVQHFRREYLNE